MKLPTNYLLATYMYIHFNFCKQMTDVKLLEILINTVNYLTMCKQMCLKIICINIYVLTGFDIRPPVVIYMS